MTYDEIAKHVEALSYRDKFRLAQLLIQIARKEEEEHKPASSLPSNNHHQADPQVIQYVAERILKLKPGKKPALLNSISAMFQFRGGIPDAEKQKYADELVKQGYVAFDDKGKVTYPRSK